MNSYKKLPWPPKRCKSDLKHKKYTCLKEVTLPPTKCNLPSLFNTKAPLKNTLRSKEVPLPPKQCRERCPGKGRHGWELPSSFGCAAPVYWVFGKLECVFATYKIGMVYLVFEVVYLVYGMPSFVFRSVPFKLRICCTVAKWDEHWTRLWHLGALGCKLLKPCWK